MSFATKKYTRPFLLNEVRALPASAFTSLAVLAKALSPRAGYRSAKVAALRQLTSRQLASVFNNGFTGKNAKTLIAYLLKN